MRLYQQNQGTKVAVALYFTGLQQQFARKMKDIITYAKFSEDKNHKQRSAKEIRIYQGQQNA